MATVIPFLADHGAMLVAGVTALLTAGCLVAALCRSPVHRQRVCEGVVVGAIVWAILACIPLPRVARLPSLEAPPDLPVVVVREIPSELLATPPGDRVAPLPAQDAIQQSIAPAAPRVPLAERLAMLFVSGAVACVAWLVLGHVMLMRIVRRATPAPAAVREMVDSCAGGRPVRVVISDRVGGPATWGAWRPMIVLPADLLHVGREAQLRQVLLHEAGHVRQGDGWGNLVFCLALPLFYFHPLYWWLRRAGDLARELVVDDWAARADGKDAYVAELVSLARARLAAGNLAGAIGMLRRRSHFYRRMRMLMQRSEPLATGCSRLWRATMTAVGLGVLVASAALVGVRPAFAQVPPPAQPAEVREAVRPTEEAKPPAERPEREQLAEARKRLMELQGQQQELMAQLAKAKADVEALSTRVKRAEVAGESKGNAEQGNPFVGRPGGGRGAAGPAEGGASVGGVQLDLVNLANSLVDASGAYKQAKIAFEERERMKNTGAVTQSEVREATARFETAQKRVELLRAIAVSALESAKANYARVKQLYQSGMVGSEQFEDLAGKVKMLELIVRGAD